MIRKMSLTHSTLMSLHEAFLKRFLHNSQVLKQKLYLQTTTEPPTALPVLCFKMESYGALLRNSRHYSSRTKCNRECNGVYKKVKLKLWTFIYSDLKRSNFECTIVKEPCW